MSLMKVNEITMQFGGLTAVSEFHVEIGHHDLIGLIGPNGAGKTTVFNMLTGIYTPTKGNIEFDENDITGMKPFDVSKQGMSRTFQNVRLFKNSTVLDNVKISLENHFKGSLIKSVLRLPSFYTMEEEIEKNALEVLKIFSLDAKKDELAKNLPYGEQRRLEIARALATKPKMLLLDEPAAGMNPQETTELMHLIKWIKEEFKISILLIEHDMKLVMGICEKIAVLDYGRLIAWGTPDEIRNNPDVIKAYLGEEDLYD